jgi:plastocyanin/mono/diheme cytochrome c family protein
MMQMSRRSAGLLALGIIAATVVVLVVLAVVEAITWGVAAGLVAAVIVSLALLYIFFGRLNNVQKTGYASLLGVVLLGLFIPLFWLGLNNDQATSQADAYQLTLHRGAALFGTYCLQCHGSTGQGLIGPQLNGSANVAKLSDDDLTRIISAGVPKSTNLSDLGGQGLQMPAWSQLYGGPLTADDISYLVALIRSSDPAYLKNNHISDTHNGFDYVFGELTTQAQRDLYNKNKGAAANYGPPKDLTGSNQVTINIINDPTNPSGWGFEFSNVQIKVGTTVTWVNISNQFHTVVSGQGTADGKFGDPNKLLAGNNQGAASTITFTFTAPGTFPYYCSLHPPMVGQIVVVP